MPEEPKIILPTGPRPALRKNPKRILFYGPPKVGKTTFVAGLPNNFIFDLEEGTELISAMSERMDSLEDVRRYGKAIMLAGRPYKHVTVDTITKLESWCEWDATLSYMNSPIGKNFNRNDNGGMLSRNEWKSVLTITSSNGTGSNFSPGYLWLRKSFEYWSDSFGVLAPSLIMIAHLRDKVIDKKGAEVSAKDIDLMGKLRNIVSANVDAIGYMYRHTVSPGVTELRINFKSSDEVLCGSRCEHLKGQDIPADWSKIFID